MSNEERDARIIPPLNKAADICIGHTIEGELRNKLALTLSSVGKHKEAAAMFERAAGAFEQHGYHSEAAHAYRAAASFYEREASGP